MVSRGELIASIKQNPMLRALRIDKLSLAALNATLQLYLPPNNPVERVPVLKMISENKESIEQRSQAVLSRLQDIDGLNCTLQDDISFAGGGSLPLSGIPSTAIQLQHETFGAAEIARRLRGGTAPVIGRIANDRLHLSLRTVLERETDDLVGATETALT